MEIKITLSDAEVKQLQDAATAARETVTDYIRLCCQLVPSCYLVHIYMPETDETHVIYSYKSGEYKIGDRVRYADDLGDYDYIGEVIAVIPQLETPETLRMRTEPIII